MPRAEVGTPKYVANQMKSKGLQRLRWYCQVCEKQCRDENGFKCHAASESHLRQMLVVGEHRWKAHLQFLSGIPVHFSSLFFPDGSFGTKRVRANQVYQEYISDKHHQHMNSTRWVTLTEFIKHLGRSGIAKVDETEKGWFIAWIDNSPKALAKAEASMKKERATTSDEQRERILIAEQIGRAAAEAEQAGSSRTEVPSEEQGLKRDDSAEKVVLSLSAKPAAVSSAATPAPLKMNAFKSSSNPLKPSVNPLKRPNVFKASAASSSSSSVSEESKKRALPMSAAEKLIIEEQERKRRRMDREALN
ncbi:hypothetical protein BT96DRAFT_961216 [Gymnopus androsaceus JB14]|uniref:DNA/RNA-binding protein Kin17 WH-like domain-containing protein n=1 Tax=Gymnopus androsaceus JB14 TaxID=1447944 RepID=A0A6A4INA9_9AGAR|nr:hypothetical protein BT96DRAFT_961216 [Gymnopus androsaceus JB14]